jgi:hypothetical protein
VVQEDEVPAALAPEPPGGLYYIAGDFEGFKNLNVMRINGDFDLFGDGAFASSARARPRPAASSRWRVCPRPAR